MKHIYLRGVTKVFTRVQSCDRTIMECHSKTLQSVQDYLYSQSLNGYHSALIILPLSFHQGVNTFNSGLFILIIFVFCTQSSVSQSMLYVLVVFRWCHHNQMWHPSIILFLSYQILFCQMKIKNFSSRKVLH